MFNWLRRKDRGSRDSQPEPASMSVEALRAAGPRSVSSKILNTGGRSASLGGEHAPGIRHPWCNATTGPGAAP